MITGRKFLLIRKNDDICLDITAMSSEGSGIGRYEGMAIFVPATTVGDKIKAHIIKVKKNYAIGKVLEIIEPSSDRKESDCPVFGRCGGCSYRHITYEAECKIKQQRVKDAMERLGGVTAPINPIAADENYLRYRNKAQYPFASGKDGEVIAGFYAQKSHRVIPCSDCKLQPKIFSKILESVLRWANRRNLSPYNEETGEGLLRHLYLRISGESGAVMVCIVINGKELPFSAELCGILTTRFKEIETIVININTEKTNVILGEECRTLYGPGYITDTLCGLSFRLSPLSFYQVNREQAQRLYRKAAEYADLKGNEVLLDLYCGTGTIGLTMAHMAKKLIGVEVVEQAVRDAEKNAMENGADNSEFICGDAAKAAAELKRRGIKPDVIIVDPPRKGCGEELINTIAEMSPERVVYISCDPATLGRDCKTFGSLGYEVKEYTPFDLFPGTVHVETACLIVKK